MSVNPTALRPMEGLSVQQSTNPYNPFKVPDESLIKIALRSLNFPGSSASLAKKIEWVNKTNLMMTPEKIEEGNKIWDIGNADLHIDVPDLPGGMTYKDLLSDPWGDDFP